MNSDRAVLLGSDGRPQVRPRRLLVPPGCLEEQEVVCRCLVPGCGERFYAGQEELWQRHVGECARRNMDRIRASVDRRPAMMREDFDPEVTAHMRDVGRRMLREGRLEVLPSERAGFS